MPADLQMRSRLGDFDWHPTFPMDNEESTEEINRKAPKNVTLLKKDVFSFAKQVALYSILLLLQQ